MSQPSLCIRSELKTLSKSLIGVPYLDGGRTTQDGMDCYGLFLYVMRELGVDLPDWEYTAGWVESGEQLFAENYYRYADRIEACDARPGDAILFRGKRKIVSHIAVYLGDDRFLHVTESIGVHIGITYHQPYNRMLEAFYRVKGLEL